jgi:hypothetical protein
LLKPRREHWGQQLDDDLVQHPAARARRRHQSAPGDLHRYGCGRTQRCARTVVHTPLRIRKKQLQRRGFENARSIWHKTTEDRWATDRTFYKMPSILLGFVGLARLC